LNWEIDEPGFVFGDIYDNVQLGSSALDNTNAVPSGSPDDVSAAFGWSFNLGAGESALIRLMVSELAPAFGFYLAHHDVGEATTLYYSTSLQISGGGGPPVIPEPGTLFLLGTGIAAFSGRCLRARRRTGASVV
jgi:hypothetical protein